MQFLFLTSFLAFTLPFLYIFRSIRKDRIDYNIGTPGKSPELESKHNTGTEPQQSIILYRAAEVLNLLQSHCLVAKLVCDKCEFHMVKES
jgi:hypothetical protein